MTVLPSALPGCGGVLVVIYGAEGSMRRSVQRESVRDCREESEVLPTVASFSLSAGLDGRPILLVPVTSVMLTVGGLLSLPSPDG